MSHILPVSQWLSESRPDGTPITWLGNQIWTLKQLRYDVVKLADNLKQHNSERWALCFENNYLFIVAFLATLAAGKTPVIPGHNRPSLLKEQQAWFDGVLSDNIADWNGTLIIVSAVKTVIPDNVPAPTIADDCCIELFTSGSTGQPKRVVKSIAGLERESVLLAAHYKTRLIGCRVVASVALQHLYGLTFGLFLPMSLGLPLHASMIYYTEQLAALDRQFRYVVISSPAFLKRFDYQLALPPVAVLFSAGGALPWEYAAQVKTHLGIWPDEIYGSTETGVIAWCSRQQTDSIWQSFSSVKITSEDECFRVISPLIDNPNGLLLDDVLHFDDTGSFRINGRRDRIVKIEEKRISLSEIEWRLMSLSGIRDAAALPVFRGSRQRIGVLLVLEEETRQEWEQSGGKALEATWRRSLLSWLEPVAVPRHWRVIDEIPVNSMNKRVYAQLQELFDETS